MKSAKQHVIGFFPDRQMITLDFHQLIHFAEIVQQDALRKDGDVTCPEGSLNKNHLSGSSATEETKVADLVKEGYHPRTPCCNYTCQARLPYVVSWNPFSKVVKCHNCGRVFVPTNDNKELLDRIDKYHIAI